MPRIRSKYFLIILQFEVIKKKMSSQGKKRGRQIAQEIENKSEQSLDRNEAFFPDKNLEKVNIGEPTDFFKQQSWPEIVNVSDHIYPDPNIIPTNPEKADKPSRKVKKLTIKCYICKKHGKKQDTKICRACKKFYHLGCISIEPEIIPKKYICEKCEFDGVDIVREKEKRKKKQEKIKDKQSKKQLTLLNHYEKLFNNDHKRNQKQRKKQQNKKRIDQFVKRYPYYLIDNRIQFPIQDKLLYIYNDIFQPIEKSKPEPKQHSLIESKFMGDFLLIQNFICTFRQEINIKYDVNKTLLFHAFNSGSRDIIFNILLKFLIEIYLKDIFEKNKTENVKALNQHYFFILITNLIQNNYFLELLPVIWPQITRHLKDIPSITKAFQNFNYQIKIQTMQDKLYVLKHFIEGLSEVDSFHDMVSRKSQKMQQMTRQRGELVAELKKDEADVLSSKQKIKQLVSVDKDLTQQIDNRIKRQDTSKLAKQQEKNKKNISKFVGQKSKGQQNALKHRSRINQINKTIAFVTTSIQYLGMDRNRSQYFFFINQPNIIYVKYKEGILDESQSFKIYESKEKIIQLTKSLNTKGVKEKSLFDSINYYLKQGIIMDEQLTIREQQNFPESFQTRVQDTSINKIKSIILELEEKFTIYLSTRNCRWAYSVKREQFKAQFKKKETVKQLKQAIRYLQDQFLFVQSLREQQVINQDDQSQQYYKNDMDLVITEQCEEYHKKLPIRLWGINSEKIKKFWTEYLENCVNILGIWICTFIFKIFVDRYIKRKMQGVQERQKKLQKQRERERQRQKQRQRIRQRQRQKEKYIQKYLEEAQNDDGQEIHRPVLRKLVRKSERNHNNYDAIKQENSEEDEENEEDQQDSQNSESDQSHDDKCNICHKFGEMLCCDTCERVFHLTCLKLKQIPQGEWSCLNCHERLMREATERQTRSRAKKFFLQ